ncbi:hypothetical protein [Massilia sp. Root335]|uniref:hypothetical protein n=1 Tax=Massilia sp. Root335 TaxID=1736517 RepID=UPI000ACE49D8|nr:hypothetical protein [Massilia sp. Root335]
MSDNEFKQVATGAKANETKGSLVKVVVKNSSGSWKSPAEGEKFYIDENGVFPRIFFQPEVDESQKCIWKWEIKWAAATSGLRESKKRGRTIKNWNQTGKEFEGITSWTADLNGLCLGGTLTVVVKSGTTTLRRSVQILGTNPTEDKIREYIATFDNIPGFDRLVDQESKFKQFISADHEPIVAFDGGYGLTQLTDPKPKYNEAWDWKANIRAGVTLYRTKRKEAEIYLKGGEKRTFTEEQLQLETWCRWNSGHYHEWDKENKKWIRNPAILSDNETANIGWDMTKEENKGKSEQELHKRDKDEYAKPPTKKSLWRYSGVVYADHVKQN